MESAKAGNWGHGLVFLFFKDGDGAWGLCAWHALSPLTGVLLWLWCSVSVPVMFQTGGELGTLLPVEQDAAKIFCVFSVGQGALELDARVLLR